MFSVENSQHEFHAMPRYAIFLNYDFEWMWKTEKDVRNLQRTTV